MLLRLFLPVLILALFASCQKSGVSPNNDNGTPQDSSNINPVDSSMPKKKYISTIRTEHGSYFELHYNNKNQLSYIIGLREQLAMDLRYDEHDRLSSFILNMGQWQKDSLVYNSKGQVSVFIRDLGFVTTRDTLYYNSINKVETIISWYGAGDSLHFQYDSDSNLTRYERWSFPAVDPHSRILIKAVEYMEYDKSVNPFHGLLPEGLVIPELIFYTDDPSDDYLQFSEHNIRLISWQNIYYKFDSAGYITEISNNDRFIFPIDNISYY